MTNCIFKLCGVKDRKIPQKFMWTDRHTDKSLILKKKDMFSYIYELIQVQENCQQYTENKDIKIPMHFLTFEMGMES